MQLSSFYNILAGLPNDVRVLPILLGDGVDGRLLGSFSKIRPPHVRLTGPLDDRAKYRPDHPTCRCGRCEGTTDRLFAL